VSVEDVDGGVKAVMRCTADCEGAAQPAIERQGRGVTGLV
jgi:hypothetical protein